VSRGATEELVAKLADYEASDLPARTKAALRYADRITSGDSRIDPPFYEALRRDLTDDELLDLGMMVMFFNGWQRLIDAFGIVPDSVGGPEQAPHAPRPSPAPE
jgi:alkylhydroperoxidase family enzyme